jgi:hypothetical protein
VDGEPSRGYDLAHLAQIEPAEVPSVPEAVSEQLKIQMAGRGPIARVQQSMDDRLDIGRRRPLKASGRGWSGLVE